MKERQCKFPLACILRQSWQDEVITEWLTHQHGEDLSPPGREIAKSQFTHIELPVRAWSHSCIYGESHTQTLWQCTVHMRARTCSKRSRYRCKKNTCTSTFMPCMRVLVCHRMPRPSPCFLSNTPTCSIKACGMTALRRCVWGRERNREDRRDRWHQSAV